MREFGTHVVDLAVRFYGELPESVFSIMPRPFDMADADLIDVVILEFSGGRAASIVLDRVCRGPHRYLEMRLDGERASLRASIGGRAGISVSFAPRRSPGARLEWAGGGQAWLEVGERRRVLARNPRNAFALGTARNLSQAIDAVSRGDSPPCSVQDARGILAVVGAAYLSARTGRRVSPTELATGRGS
jgi:predicted dehydrogenase